MLDFGQSDRISSILAEMQSIEVRADGVDLAAGVWGAGRRAVVLVHGHRTNLLSWLPVVEELRDDFTLVAYDRRGQGRSGRGPSYALGDLADDLRAVCDHLSITAPLVVGHSVGAWDALEFARHRPGLTGVLCLDQAIATEDPQWRVSYPRRPRELRLARARRSDPTADAIFTRAELDRILITAQDDPRWQPWSRYSPMLGRTIHARGGGRFQTRPLLDDQVLLEEAWSMIAAEPYDSISCPVHLVLADRNPGPIHDMLLRLASRRDLGLLHAPTDHDVHVERPDLVADLVRQLIKDGDRD